MNIRNVSVKVGLVASYSALALLMSAPRTMAHGGEGLTEQTVWSAWNFTPEVSGLTALTLVIYLRGAVRRRTSSGPQRPLRHLMFIAGILSLFLALQSPVDAMAEPMFLAHQIQHILLRMVGPMLIVLSYPEAVLIAGLPRQVRKRLIAPVLTNRRLSTVFSTLTRPWAAFWLFVLSLYVWQIPSVHNAALTNSAIHYAMHITMLIAGFLFFAMIFSRRDTKASHGHGLRIFLLFATIVSNILLGALTTLKEVVLYTAYDIEGRLFGILPLVDETGGGYIIWVPSSMMIIIAIIATFRGWNAAEERRFARRYEWTGSNSAALEFPETAAELRIKVAGPNRRMGQSLALGSLALFSIVLATAITVLQL